MPIISYLYLCFDNYSFIDRVKTKFTPTCFEQQSDSIRFKNQYRERYFNPLTLAFSCGSPLG